MFAAKEPHNDVDDDGGPLKETHWEETQGEQPEERLRTQKGGPYSSSPFLAILKDGS